MNEVSNNLVNRITQSNVLDSDYCSTEQLREIVITSDFNLKT